tara:strand:- start:1009 stop:2535 length:1527 start_codon:yes stop_codon:yes gene_type:complete
MCNSIIQGIALDIIEIDAASNTGVENIREIIERAKFAPTQARWKVYVIDECHMLSTAASNALLKTIEEPPGRVVFILATTNPEKVLNTIHSRCQKFDFRRINTSEIYKHLINIAKKEKISFEEIALKLIAKRANGGMRDAQSTLDQLSLLPEGVTKTNVEDLLGEVSEIELINLINSIIDNKPELLIENCSNLYDSGNEPIAILEGLLNITRDLLLKTNENYSELFYTSEDFQDELNRISKKIHKSEIIDWHSSLKTIEYQIKNSSQPRLWLEIHLTSLLKIKSKDSNIITELRKEAKHLIDNKTEISIETKKNSDTDSRPKNNTSLEKLASIDYKNSITENPKPIYDDNRSIELKEKWSLILSKLELPSTRMLLSQQAELISIQDDSIEIALSPNWENMIKSRKIVIENAVKKVFGDNYKIKYSNSKNLNAEIQKNNEKKINPTTNSNRTSTSPSKINSKNEISREINTPETSSNEMNPIIQKVTLDKNSSKNLANFFNGEIIDIED